MPERPLLKLPEPEAFDPKPSPPGGGNLAKPARARQGARLSPRFDRLMQVAGSPQDLMGLRDDPASIAPEYVDVTIKRFQQNVSDVPVTLVATGQTFEQVAAVRTEATA